jgi:hypothetical protein
MKGDMAVKLRQAGGALCRALLSSICTRWYPTPLGLRRPLCFYNGLGRLLLRCRAYFELKLAPDAPSRRFLRVVSLEAPEPNSSLVARIREDYEMCRRLESGALSERWTHAAQTFETEFNPTTLRRFRRNAVGDSPRRDRAHAGRIHTRTWRWISGAGVGLAAMLFLSFAILDDLLMF